MRILFVIGAGILPEQRIRRWQMVSQLYAKLGKSFLQLGHQIYYYIHPEAYSEEVPEYLTWLCEDHRHMDIVMENFKPDYVFCWNGSSTGDLTTTTIANKYGAKMVYSEQGWFPQKSTLYFDFTGCNGKCSTRNKEYPELTPGQKNTFLKMREQWLNEIGEKDNYNISKYDIQTIDLNKPIFVPLQDERDLNIVQDSYFKTMNDFLGFLSQAYPDQKFIARPHPKYPSPDLSNYPNVELDNPKQPMFETLKQCGMVIGINSTTLLESALLGYPVISFGESLATGTGLLCDARYDDYPKTLNGIKIDSKNAMSVLYTLLCTKQMFREKLDDPITLMKSLIFREMAKELNWNNIYR